MANLDWSNSTSNSSGEEEEENTSDLSQLSSLSNQDDSSRVSEILDEDQRRFEAMFDTANGVEIRYQESDAPMMREHEEFCEVSPPRISNCGGPRGMMGDDADEDRDTPVFYAPDRPPPLFDFLTIMTAFAVAVFAAYYTV